MAPMYNPLVGDGISRMQPVASPDAPAPKITAKPQITPSTSLGLMIFGCVGILAMLHMGGFRTTVAIGKG